MIVDQFFHDFIRLRSAVVNIADNMQMVDHQSLRAVGKAGDQLIGLAERNDLFYDFGIVLFLVGGLFCFVQKLFRNISKLGGQRFAQFGAGVLEEQ